jgi:hypothetical protein
VGKAAAHVPRDGSTKRSTRPSGSGDPTSIVIIRPARRITTAPEITVTTDQGRVGVDAGADGADTLGVGAVRRRSTRTPPECSGAMGG